MAKQLIGSIHTKKQNKSNMVQGFIHFVSALQQPNVPIDYDHHFIHQSSSKVFSKMLFIF